MMAFAGTAISAGAMASVQLPVKPVEPQQFDSFPACDAYLKQRHSEGLQGTDGSPERA